MEFKIKITDCKNCPHVEWFAYGPDCDLNNGDWPIVSTKSKGNGISVYCPYRNRPIGNEDVIGR